MYEQQPTKPGGFLTQSSLRKRTEITEKSHLAVNFVVFFALSAFGQAFCFCRMRLVRQIGFISRVDVCSGD